MGLFFNNSANQRRRVRVLIEDEEKNGIYEGASEAGVKIDFGPQGIQHIPVEKIKDLSPTDEDPVE
jgi:hypothetical protein